MIDVLLNTCYFLLIMLIAVFFKRVHLLKKEDSQILSKIIVNLTLPCVFFSSCKGIVLSKDMLFYLCLGFIVNFFMMAIVYLLYHAQDHLEIKMIGCSGYDVGNFVLPYIQLYFPYAAIQFITVFNIGNTIMANGGVYSIASLTKSFDLKSMLKNLFSSVCFDIYLLILVIAVFRINVPDFLISITSKIASANTLLVMMMIGLKLDFHMDTHSIHEMIEILSTRIIGAIILCILTSLFPIESSAKIILYMIYFGPMVSVSSIYAAKTGYQGDVIANCNTITIFISLLMSSLILMICL